MNTAPAVAKMNAPASLNSDNPMEIATHKKATPEEVEDAKKSSHTVGSGKGSSPLKAAAEPEKSVAEDSPDDEPKSKTLDLLSPETEEDEEIRLDTEMESSHSASSEKGSSPLKALAKPEKSFVEDSPDDEPKSKTLDLLSPETEEDKDIRLDMEMELAAAQNAKKASASEQVSSPLKDATEPEKYVAGDSPHDAPKSKTLNLPSPETEEDEDIRLATEMALAAAQNAKKSTHTASGSGSSPMKVVAQPAKSMVEDSPDDEPKSKTLDLPSLETEEDEEIRLAMEMALAAAQNPHLSPAEIQKLVGQKNGQAKMIDEFSKQKEEKIKQNQEKFREQRWGSKKDGGNSWWSAAAKKAEEMKDRAERRMYADQIRNDEEIIEVRKKFKILKKTLKAHRLQGNRVETRHVFKRQRIEKKLMQACDKLTKTQHLFTHSSYNVQEYLKATMRASKKWRKLGTDEELTLEAQLSRNMHQMLALEKQKVKCNKNTKEMKKYLQRCKGWLSDKKAFCEMNIMTLDATQSSMLHLCEETLRRQDALIAKLKASDEFKDVDLSSVEVPRIDFPKLSSAKDPERSAAMDAMRGLPIIDSIRVKKEQLVRASSNAKLTDEEEEEAQLQALGQAQTRQNLVQSYYTQQEQLQQAGGAPELYVVAKDDVSVSSHLSDPDGTYHDEDESDSDYDHFGHDAPWMTSAGSNVDSVENESTDVYHAAILEAKKVGAAMSSVKPAPDSEGEKLQSAKKSAASAEDAQSTDTATVSTTS